MYVVSDFLSLFYPSLCLTCSVSLVQGEEWMCTACCYDLPHATSHQDLDNIVAQRLYGKVSFQYAFAAYKFHKKSKIQTLIHHLKYKNKPAIARWIGKRYGYTLLDETYISNPFDLIIPVPLHSSKLQERGYNQSEYFAQGLAEVLNVPWSNQCLRRIKETATQTHKNQLERFENVEGAFCVIDPAAINNKHVLLVDDIITTGTTLEACGTALLALGKTKISVATIAVTE